MREKPILFRGPMVRAIIDGTKTQTRRTVKVPGATLDALDAPVWPMLPGDCHGMQRAACPYDADRLWVRETFYCDDYRHPNIPEPERGDPAWRERSLYYRADVASGRFEDAGYWAETGSCWYPSIHMPRWASRLTLPVESIRVERLNDITEEDARAEGVGELGRVTDARGAFVALWESINGERSGCDWRSNPWVWRIAFSRATP